MQIILSSMYFQYRVLPIDLHKDIIYYKDKVKRHNSYEEVYIQVVIPVTSVDTVQRLYFSIKSEVLT